MFANFLVWDYMSRFIPLDTWHATWHSIPDDKQQKLKKLLSILNLFFLNFSCLFILVFLSLSFFLSLFQLNLQNFPNNESNKSLSGSNLLQRHSINSLLEQQDLMWSKGLNSPTVDGKCYCCYAYLTLLLTMEKYWILLFFFFWSSDFKRNK